jgi:hypothetical protein
MIRHGMRTFAHRLILSLAATLAFAAPAGAAEVARIDEATLDARDSTRTSFCLRLTFERSGSSGGSSTCGAAPWRPRRSNLVTSVAGAQLLAAGAVPASITRAEAEFVDGRRVAIDTVAGPGYRGRHAGKLRFFLAALPLADPDDTHAGGLVAVRFFDADGTLVGVAPADRARPSGAGRGCCASAAAAGRSPSSGRRCSGSRRRRSRSTTSKR